MKSTARPSSRRRRNSSRSLLASCSPSTAVGSSRINTCASLARHLAISTYWQSAMESSLTARSRSISAPSMASSARARSRCCERSTAIPARNVGSRPSNTFSATLSVATRLSSWCTMEMPARIAARGPRSVLGSPLRSSSPAFGVSAPESTFISVLLPAPFSPTMA